MAKHQPSNGTADSPLPADLDLWISTEFEHLPADLSSAFDRADWPEVKNQLRAIMDSVATETIYGRELFQLVRKLPLGVDRLFDRYRAAAAVDYGDWDDLRLCLATGPIGSEELEGLRDVWLAPVDCFTPPPAKQLHQAMLFEPYEADLQRSYQRLRRWARRMLNLSFTEIVWSREDIPASRHFRNRRLQDVTMLAIGEAHGGRLAVSEALSREAQRLGDEREALRVFAHDLEGLVRLARGQSREIELRFLRTAAGTTGPSPVGTWQVLNYLMPFLSLVDDGSFDWSSRLAERTAARLASPRAILQGVAWRVASELLAGRSPSQTELPGLLEQSRSAAAGIRVLPQLLYGYGLRRYSSFADALDLARRSGNVWAQVSALAWMAALDPTPWVCRSLHRLLEVTGWRRLVLVPPQIAADAALALSAGGLRGVGIVELALLSGRANVTVEIAAAHLDDAATPEAARLAAVQALGKLGTMRSRAILVRLLSRRDDLSGLARSLLTKPSGDALSDREVEVLDLAGKGLTNRDIAARLGLSEHTVARHVANARNKLGAANRAEAVSRLRELRPDQ